MSTTSLFCNVSWFSVSLRKRTSSSSGSRSSASSEGRFRLSEVSRAQHHSFHGGLQGGQHHADQAVVNRPATYFVSPSSASTTTKKGCLVPVLVKQNVGPSYEAMKHKAKDKEVGQEFSQNKQIFHSITRTTGAKTDSGNGNAYCNEFDRERTPIQTVIPHQNQATQRAIVSKNVHVDHIVCSSADTVSNGIVRYSTATTNGVGGVEYDVPANGLSPGSQLSKEGVSQG
ncbi:unnamed protein product [Protopolystoma xenopodis]|uniref:Uncharacterized protein n=1 Tax=Protopolystoma xenopodis TaxID=117903 RepID=A0A3S5FGL2_9PLAT|nr:unnamed protein product [Protopolystoma xenopodis]